MTLPQQIIELIPKQSVSGFNRCSRDFNDCSCYFCSVYRDCLPWVKRKDPEHGEFFAKIIDTFYSVVMRVVTLILRLTPYGILPLLPGLRQRVIMRYCQIR